MGPVRGDLLLVVSDGRSTTDTTLVRVSPESYDKVIGGFSWVTNYAEGTNPQSAPPIEFYLDDLVWE